MTVPHSMYANTRTERLRQTHSSPVKDRIRQASFPAFTTSLQRLNESRTHTEALHHQEYVALMRHSATDGGEL